MDNRPPSCELSTASALRARRHRRRPTEEDLRCPDRPRATDVMPGAEPFAFPGSGPTAAPASCWCTGSPAPR